MSKSNKRTIISKDVVFIKLIQGQECLLMKQGNLFCFVCYVEISQTTTFHVATFNILGKLLMSRGASTWFEIV